MKGLTNLWIFVYKALLVQTTNTKNQDCTKLLWIYPSTILT